MKKKAYIIINGYVVVKFLSQVIFIFFCFKCMYPTQKQKKNKKLHDVKNYNRYIKVIA